MMKKIFARRDFFARVTTGFHRHGQARPGHPGLLSYERCKVWIPGSSPGMTPVFVDRQV